MNDDLLLPTVPEPSPDDPEDVSWALSTAEAMWTRGDHAEGIKWVRRAAEAAAEADNDARALELAKAAADLTALISRGASRTSIEIEEIVETSPLAVPPSRPPHKPPPPKPAAAAKAPSTPIAKPVATPSRPPAPLPSRTSQPPAVGRASGPPAGLSSSTKLVESSSSDKPQSARAATSSKSSSEGKKDARRSSRRSRDNLEAEARLARSAGVAPRPRADAAPAKRPAGSEAGWEADSTQALTGDELPFAEGERQTVVAPRADDAASSTERVPGGAPRASSRGAEASSSPPASRRIEPQAIASGAPTSVRDGGRASPSLGHPPSARPHDPGLVTSQAIRVVVWRDGAGVHVAPAGTVVSAITVDAVLVALDPNTDLTAWLTPKGR